MIRRRGQVLLCNQRSRETLLFLSRFSLLLIIKHHVSYVTSISMSQQKLDTTIYL